MKTPGLDLRDLTTLLALDDSGSLTLASRALNLSVSALSHRIRELERRLNVPLVVRGSKLSLTPEALRLVPLATEAMQNIQDMERIAQTPQHVFALGVSFILSQSLLGPLLPETLREFPHIHWKIHTGNSQQVERWIETGQVNAGIIRMEQSRPNLSYQVIGRDSMVAVSHPDKAPRRTLARDDLSSLDWITFSPDIGHGRTVMEHLHAINVVLPSVIEVDSLELGMKLVHSGVGAAVLPWSLVSSEIMANRLVVMNITDIVWPNRYIALAHMALTPIPTWVSDWPSRLRQQVAWVNGED